MRFIIDSNIFIYAAAGVKEALAVLDDADASDWSGYSGITRLDVLGYRKFNKDEEGKLNEMLACFDESDVSRAVIDEAVKLRQAVSIKVPDAIVAATALLYDATLVTRNDSDFQAVPALKVLNPFE